MFQQILVIKNHKNRTPDFKKNYPDRRIRQNVADNTEFGSNIYSKKYTEIEYNHLLPVLTKRNAEYIPKIVVYVNWNIDTKNDANTS